MTTSNLLEKAMKNETYGWIGVDLDGTLAHYDRFVDILSIGEPIPAMVERVKAWIADGWEVRIFTARVGLEPWVVDRVTNQYIPMSTVIATIEDWAEKHIGTRLRATCIKDMHMIELYDDRAVGVEKNTGRLLNPSTRGY